MIFSLPHQRGPDYRLHGSDFFARRQAFATTCHPSLVVLVQSRHLALVKFLSAAISPAMNHLRRGSNEGPHVVRQRFARVCADVVDGRPIVGMGPVR